MLVISVPSSGMGISVATNSGRHLATLVVAPDGQALNPVVTTADAEVLISVAASESEGYMNDVNVKHDIYGEFNFKVAVRDHCRNNVPGFSLAIDAPRNLIITKIRCQ